MPLSASACPRRWVENSLTFDGSTLTATMDGSMVQEVLGVVDDHHITSDWCFAVGGRTSNTSSLHAIKNLRITGVMASPSPPPPAPPSLPPSPQLPPLAPGDYLFDCALDGSYNGWACISATTCGSAYYTCLLYTSPSPRDRQKSRMPSSA